MEPLRVNHRSYVSSNTVLGRNVNFNGMRIIGGGEVVIGDNFHSGAECIMITEYHKYDSGNAIPYDLSETVRKDIIIEEKGKKFDPEIVDAFIANIEEFDRIRRKINDSGPAFYHLPRQVMNCHAG